jgi:hypothetical protein
MALVALAWMAGAAISPGPAAGTTPDVVVGGSESDVRRLVVPVVIERSIYLKK